MIDLEDLTAKFKKLKPGSMATELQRNKRYIWSVNALRLKRNGISMAFAAANMSPSISKDTYKMYEKSLLHSDETRIRFKKRLENSFLKPLFRLFFKKRKVEKKSSPEKILKHAPLNEKNCRYQVFLQFAKTVVKTCSV